VGMVHYISTRTISSDSYGSSTQQDKPISEPRII
jgi:hypothetical protein